MKPSILCLVLVSAGLISCKPDPAPEPEIPPAAAAPDPSNPDGYLGLEEKAAGAAADKSGLKWRVIEVDGEPRPVTMDYRPDRLNFAIKDGKVIRVTNG
jgi:hypothetical protein